MPELLFVYGTLRPGYAPPEIADAVATFVPIGPGKIRGRRYDLGPYPGVVLDENSPDSVSGHVFAVPDHAILAQLDAYEDFRLDDPESSLFLRRTTTVILDTGEPLLCWVYAYNRPV